MKILNYILAMVEGKDGQLSIRRVMAFLVLGGLIRHVEKCPDNAEVAFVLSSLIAALLALTTWSNIKERQQQTEP